MEVGWGDFCVLLKYDGLVGTEKHKGIMRVVCIHQVLYDVLLCPGKVTFFVCLRVGLGEGLSI